MKDRESGREGESRREENLAWRAVVVDVDVDGDDGCLGCYHMLLPLWSFCSVDGESTCNRQRMPGAGQRSPLSRSDWRGRVEVS